MNFTLAMITIFALSICGPEKNIIIENQTVKKHITTKKTESVIYKKVPTKWVKITKKSN